MNRSAFLLFFPAMFAEVDSEIFEDTPKLFRKTVCIWIMHKIIQWNTFLFVKCGWAKAHKHTNNPGLFRLYINFHFGSINLGLCGYFPPLRRRRKFKLKETWIWFNVIQIFSFRPQFAISIHRNEKSFSLFDSIYMFISVIPSSRSVRGRGYTHSQSRNAGAPALPFKIRLN